MRLFKYILTLFIVCALAFLFTRYVAIRSIVDGASMEPTLYDKDQLIIDRLSYRMNSPKRGDIVVFPGIPEEEGSRPPYYIKRIVGLPGEEIQIRDGNVWINGELLDEAAQGPYEKMQEAGMAFEPYRIPEGSYFVLGDNRNHSSDSRNPLLGPVSREKIIGKVMFRIWPLERIGQVKK